MVQGKFQVYIRTKLINQESYVVLIELCNTNKYINVVRGNDNPNVLDIFLRRQVYN
jgi:hypothetical protein